MEHTELLFVQITAKCNMDCGYCPFSYRNTITDREKDFTAQIKSVKNILTSNLFTKNSFHGLIIYGGEPLLHFEQIKKTVTEYKKLKTLGNITLCTNGVLFNSKIITYCKAHKIHVAVNIDGDFSLVKSIKTFSKTNWLTLIESLKILEAKKISFDFSATITPRFIKNFNTQIKFLESLSPRMIGFNFLRDKHAQKKFKISNPDKYLKNAMSLVFEYASPINFNRNKKINAFKNKKQAPDCICTGSGLTVLAKGNYTTCGIFPSQTYKTISEVIRTSKENRVKLFSHNDLQEKIKELPTFGGGCAKLSQEDNQRFSCHNALESFNQFNYEKL